MGAVARLGVSMPFSAGIPRGLIEAFSRNTPVRFTHPFSAGIPRGLIEAQRRVQRFGVDVSERFPRVFPAASLKQADFGVRSVLIRGFSAGIPRGLIEAGSGRTPRISGCVFSAGIPRGLIEAGRRTSSSSRADCFPRVFPAASLKRRVRRQGGRRAGGFPRVFPAASLKPPYPPRRRRCPASRFPRVFPAASLKHVVVIPHHSCRQTSVFRGYSPRPH